ncbi:MAG: radical SAM protein [Phycisphaerales bacterium]|nr:radical SAM protein [Phycisphaerales bacterium]
MNAPSNIPLRQAYRQHTRSWRNNAYVYPVVSRRSGGLSIGVNLNPDKACNFDCIYCQVDRQSPPTVRKVNLDQVKAELDGLLDIARDQSLYADAPFDCLPPSQRRVCDIAFSGDGEPTTYPQFDEAVRLVADTKRVRGLKDAKIVLITDACYLTKPKVRNGLKLMDENNGEVWAKLDAGTEDYYQLVNRPNYPLSHVLDNILDAARARPLVIQSLWMKVHGEPPPNDEVLAFTNRINDMVAAGGRFKLIQVYTIARQTTEAYATALSAIELDRVANVVETTDVPVERYHGVGD